MADEDYEYYTTPDELRRQIVALKQALARASASIDAMGQELFVLRASQLQDMLARRHSVYFWSVQEFFAQVQQCLTSTAVGGLGSLLHDEEAGPTGTFAAATGTFAAATCAVSPALHAPIDSSRFAVLVNTLTHQAIVAAHAALAAHRNVFVHSFYVGLAQDGRTNDGAGAGDDDAAVAHVRAAMAAATLHDETVVGSRRTPAHAVPVPVPVVPSVDTADAESRVILEHAWQQLCECNFSQLDWVRVGVSAVSRWQWLVRGLLRRVSVPLSDRMVTRLQAYASRVAALAGWCTVAGVPFQLSVPRVRLNGSSDASAWTPVEQWLPPPSSSGEAGALDAAYEVVDVLVAPPVQPPPDRGGQLVFPVGCVLTPHTHDGAPRVWADGIPPILGITLDGDVTAATLARLVDAAGVRWCALPACRIRSTADNSGVTTTAAALALYDDTDDTYARTLDALAGGGGRLHRHRRRRHKVRHFYTSM